MAERMAVGRRAGLGFSYPQPPASPLSSQVGSNKWRETLSGSEISRLGGLGILKTEFAVNEAEPLAPSHETSLVKLLFALAFLFPFHFGRKRGLPAVHRVGDRGRGPPLRSVLLFFGVFFPPTAAFVVSQQEIRREVARSSVSLVTQPVWLGLGCQHCSAQAFAGCAKESFISFRPLGASGLTRP